MDELFIPLLGLSAFSIVAELVSIALRWLRSKITRETLKRVADVGILLFSCAFIFGLLATLVWVSATFVYGAMAPGERPSFNQVILAFGALFASSLAFVHIFAYSFAGLLHRWPLGGKLWPKGIDYVYYVFGAAVLVLVLANIYEQKSLLAEAARAEVVAGAYLLSLKLFKTSYELFPEKFKWTGGWIRDPFFGKVI